jgi:hypothetical protein
MLRLSLVDLLLNRVQLSRIVKGQDVDALPLIGAVIDPVVAILRGWRSTLVKDLLRGLSHILVVGDVSARPDAEQGYIR